jgi:hypothetical protein
MADPFLANDLIDYFERHEKGVELKGVSPREARLGRWVLLYAALQVLSQLSVDNKGLKYTNGVDYLLCSSIKKCPPWDPNGRLPVSEASQQDSYCWLAPDRWDQEYLRTGGGSSDRGSSTLNEADHIMNQSHGHPNEPSELDGRGITNNRRLDKQFGSMFIEEKGLKYKVESPRAPQVPQRSPLRDYHLSEKNRMTGGYFDDDAGIHFVEG